MVETDVASAPPSDPVDSSHRSFLLRHELTNWDLATAVVALLLCIAFAPPLMFGAWTTRMAITLVVGPIGLVLLVLRCLRRDIAGLVAAGALCWAVLSAVLSGLPRSSLIGTASRDLSVLTVVLAFCVWAFSRQVSENGRRVLPHVIVWALVLGAVVGILQVVFDVRTGPLSLAGDRPQGFATNPVYFGALCSAGLGAAIALDSQTSRRFLWWAVAPLGIATSLSGSRVALLGSLIVIALVVSAYRTRGAALAAGAALASLVAGVAVDRVFGAGRNAADRLVNSTGGGRTQVWWYGIEAWFERPLLGHGLGRFRPAVQHRFSAEFVRDFAPDELTQAWFDPHNVIVNLLVATGIVGLVAFVGWGLLCAVRCEGPLGFALIPVCLSWMLQPVGIVVLPLAMLMLGVAMSAAHSRVEVDRRTLIGLGALGSLMASYLLVADIGLRRAADDLDGSRAAAAAGLFANDAVVADIVGQVYRYDESSDDRAERRREWQRVAADAEPDRPYWWSQLGERYIEAGMFEEAREALARAHDLQPFNVRTLRTEIILALRSNDDLALERLLVDSCDLGFEVCGTDVDQMRADYEAAIGADGP